MTSFDFSKKFIYFNECDLKYWFSEFSPELAEIEESEQNSKSIKKEMMDFLVEKFPSRIEVQGISVSEKSQETKRLIKENETVVLYNAYFEKNKQYVKIDILKKNDDGSFNFYLIKPIESYKISSFIRDQTETAEIKYYLKELAFHSYILRKNGINSTPYLISLNSNYKRDGDINMALLFKEFHMEKFVFQFEKEISDKMSEIKKINKKPIGLIGTQCKNPFPCPFSKQCWNGISERSIHYIPRISPKKRTEFLAKGWDTIDKISDMSELTDIQANVVRNALAKKERKNAMKMMIFISKIQYPIQFLDFEAYFPAIPKFNQSKPLAAIPTQYSLHSLEKNGQLNHKEFIHSEDGDPRRRLAEALCRDIPEKGSIIVYNKTFEHGVISGLIELYPDLKVQLESFLNRLIDLMTPFKEGDYYHPDMGFSYSLKAVAPALDKKLTYENLVVKDGESAMFYYQRMLSEKDVALKNEMIKNLLEYCKMDTYVMVRILEIIKK